MVKAIQFHRVTPRFQFCGTWNYPEQFDRFVCFLKRNARLIVPGEGSSGIVITFDDGDKSIYQYAFPILKKHAVRAVIFLIVGYIGKHDQWDISIAGSRRPHLSWDEIMEMKNWGMIFGSHTMSHRNLTRIPKNEMVYELRESKRILENRLGSVACVSYPFNRTNAEIGEQARLAGYRYGFGGEGTDDLLIKKEAVYITDNMASLATKINEHPEMLYWYDRVKQRVINYFTMATMLIKR